MYKKQVAMMLRSYESAVLWSEEPDTEAALQNAINGTFHEASDERKAELYTRLVDGGFLEWGSGAIRRMNTQQLVDRWYYDHVFGPTSEELECSDE